MRTQRFYFLCVKKRIVASLTLAVCEWRVESRVDDDRSGGDSSSVTEESRNVSVQKHSSRFSDIDEKKNASETTWKKSWNGCKKVELELVRVEIWSSSDEHQSNPSIISTKSINSNYNNFSTCTETTRNLQFSFTSHSYSELKTWFVTIDRVRSWHSHNE